MMLTYQAMHGGEYNAKMLRMYRIAGRDVVDIEVIIPNCQQTLTLTKIEIGTGKGMARTKDG